MFKNNISWKHNLDTELSHLPSLHISKVKKWKLISLVWPSVTPRTVAHQAPLSMGFSRQEYWNRLPFPSPGGSSQPRDRTQVSCIAGRFFTIWAPREAPLHTYKYSQKSRKQNEKLETRSYLRKVSKDPTKVKMSITNLWQLFLLKFIYFPQIRAFDCINKEMQRILDRSSIWLFLRSVISQLASNLLKNYWSFVLNKAGEGIPWQCRG